MSGFMIMQWLIIILKKPILVNQQLLKFKEIEGVFF